MSLIFISFIFKLNETIFYGKYYTDTISSDSDYLDEKIKPYLIKGISEYQKQENLSEVKEDIHIGIISVTNDKYFSIDSSDNEKNCFDFYCKNFTINYKKSLKMYMFGKLIENPEL